MSKRESISRYTLIIKKLRKKPATFAEISEYLSFESELQEYDFNISIRTFQRDRKDILSLYQINIQYNFSKKTYYIEDDHNPAINERILEAFDTFNALNLADRLSNHIHFEKRRPQGTENLYGLLHAIKNEFQIKFNYQKFWDEKPMPRHAEPYAVKEFKSRWYILVNDLKDNCIKSFAFDRLSDLEITKEPFHSKKEFDANEHYKYCFGIISPNDKNPQKVILSFNLDQAKYIKTLPLHESQKILIDNDQELRIELTIFITHDFYMEILSFGHNVKVLEPQSLIKMLQSNSKKVQILYNC